MSEKLLEKLRKIQFIWLAVILALGLVIAVNNATKNMSGDKITVTGSAYKNVQADSARMAFEITTRKPDKQAAYNTIKTQLPLPSVPPPTGQLLRVPLLSHWFGTSTPMTVTGPTATVPSGSGFYA